MTREELLESAALDAFGLLDEYEAALYTRSFHHAPAAIQREIIQLQADLVSDETLLIEDKPDPRLRERVLEAVAVAIEQETAELEPLATIGRTRPLAAEPIGRIPLTASGQFWRAAVFALLGCLVVVLYFLSTAADRNAQIVDAALGMNTEKQIEELFGPTAKTYLFDQTARRVFFAASPRGAQMEGDLLAKLYVNETTGDALLITADLPLTKTEAYSLWIKDAGGTSEPVHRFASNGRLWGTRFELKRVAARLQNVTWEIRDAGGVLLASI
jgi:hypothetical protein